MVAEVSQYARQAKDISPTVWVYKDADGSIKTREQTQDERLAILIPPKGEYRLKVKAFAEPFERPKSQQYGGGMQEKTILLLEVQGGPGNGKLCTLWATYVFSKGSNLGKIFKAVTGIAITPGSVPDPIAMLEGEFTAYLQPSQNLDDNGKPKGTDCSMDTVASVGDAVAAAAGSDWA